MKIANWVEVIRNFYTPFEISVEKAGEIERVKFEEKPTGGVCPKLPVNQLFLRKAGSANSGVYRLSGV